MGSKLINGLKIIGEKINYSIPRIGTLMEFAQKTNNFEEIKKIAQTQESNGADYLDINIGLLPISMMALTTKAVQEVVDIPLCFDSDNVSKLESGLEAYDYSKNLPILNSATESRIKSILSLKNKKDYQLVLLVSERGDKGSLAQNISSEDAYKTAKRLFLKSLDYGIQPNQIYIDPGMSPIGADQQGLVNMTLNTIEKINSDYEMKGVHTLVGLTNLTFSLPPKAKLPLQNAFITLAIKKGLDTIIGNPKKKYQTLDDENPYLKALQEVLKSENKLETFVSEVYPLIR